MERRITAAVVGTGFIGPVHVEGLRRAGVHVAGILGSSPGKSVEAATCLDLPRGYAALDEISSVSIHYATKLPIGFETGAWGTCFT
ncbi:MAG: hypothetical protein SGI77_17935 [Pirellulaceae bacterium]|nr:hypothetical protein [Pirellulaceae bacterium]